MNIDVFDPQHGQTYWANLWHHAPVIFSCVPFITAFKNRSPLPSFRELRQVRSHELVLGWGCASLPYFSLQTAEFGQQKEMSKKYEIQIGTYTEAGPSGSEEFPARKFHPWESAPSLRVQSGCRRCLIGPLWGFHQVFGFWSLSGSWKKPASVKPQENRQLSNLPKSVCFTNYTQSLWDLHISLLFAWFNPTLHRPTATSKLKLYQKSWRRFERKWKVHCSWFTFTELCLCSFSSCHFIQPWQSPVFISFITHLHYTVSPATSIHTEYMWIQFQCLG